jgi:hypothetical protein
MFEKMIFQNAAENGGTQGEVDEDLDSGEQNFKIYALIL